MDLETTVAVSMLPASRSNVAAAFKDLRHTSERGPAFLEVVWSAAGKKDILTPAAICSLLDAAAQALDAAAKMQIEAVALFDARYPALLACIPDPPPVLWAQGRLDCLERPTVAIVGSRAATPYALEVGGRISAELARLGVLVASGLARGVDSAAHRGCLREQGRTIAVLGSGLDRVYPPEHADLAAEIGQAGLLLTELAPGAAALPAHFPLRNRIISGISLATVVVEASEHSGSLITARCALEQGREVMAVPGSVLSGRNRGSHALLKDGAKVVESADDILQELGWCGRVASDKQPKSLISDPLLGHMAPGESYDLDHLAEVSGIAGARLLAKLTELELGGLIEVSTGRFTRRPSPAG
jgi:DNA processing protein